MAEVTLYTKDYCPYCKAAKALLSEKGIDFTDIDVTHDEAKQQEMLAKSEGRTSVPEIFINGKLIGGFDDMKALDESGELDKLLGL